MSDYDEENRSSFAKFTGVIWRIYCIPGRIIAEFWYLWSKKGQIWGSGRRRNHQFVHFFYSTVFWFITFLVVSLFSVAGTHKPSSDTASSFNTERQVTDTELRDEPKPEVASLPQQADLDVSPNEDMPDHGQAKAPDKPVLSPDMFDNAMKEAFETGKTVRIESNGIKGYAVPSEPQTESGCRSIEFTIDGNDQASRSKTICP